MVVCIFGDGYCVVSSLKSLRCRYVVGIPTSSLSGRMAVVFSFVADCFVIYLGLSWIPWIYSARPEEAVFHSQFGFLWLGEKSGFLEHLCKIPHLDANEVV